MQLKKFVHATLAARQGHVLSRTHIPQVAESIWTEGVVYKLHGISCLTIRAAIPVDVGGRSVIARAPIL